MSYSHLGGEPRESFVDLQDTFKMIESFMGYLPNSHLSMAKNPNLNDGFSALAGTIFGSKHLGMDLVNLIALASSLSSGCKYCQAHTSHGASRAGVNSEKIAEILKFKESDQFSSSEKAALDLAFAAGVTPNASKKEHFIELKNYFSDEAIIDIVAVIALFGFLNRWNDTLGTKLEDVPKEFVEKELRPLGWNN
ncbi:MAG: carboxymuconolactone decarboxylase family protein [Pseudomonadota bacterium]|nr:carboxymuconolactone decarboxylase family protein [Pseudomonadota bacterium]